MNEKNTQQQPDARQRGSQSGPSENLYYGGAYSAGYYGSGQGSNMISRIRKYIGMVRRHWLTVVLAGLFGLTAGVYRVRIATKIYQATAMIEMRARRPSITGREGAIIEDRSYVYRGSESIINTRLKKLNSKSTRDRVVQYLNETGSDQLLVAAKGSYRKVSKTFLVSITCRHSDPELVARSANAYAEVARILALEENKGDSDNAVAWLEAQADIQGKVLEDNGIAIVKFRSENNLDFLESNKQTADAKVLALNKELVAIRSQQVQAEDVCKTLKNLDLTLDDIGKIPPSAPGADEIQRKVEALRTLSASRDALLVKYRNMHPKILASDKNIEVHLAEVLKAVKQANAASQAGLNLLIKQVASIDEEMEKYRSQAMDLDHKIITLSSQFESLQRAKTAADISYRGILKRMEDARLSADEKTTTVKIVEKAVVPECHVSPNRRRMLALGLLIGLTCGAGLAYLKEILDDLVSSSGEVEELLGLRVLGLIPHRKKAVRSRLATVSMKEGSHLMSEAFASIRTVLSSPQYRENTRSLLVTSTAPEEGKTVIACNLAITFARSGKKTLLVDFDLRRPRIENIFFGGLKTACLMEVLSQPSPQPGDFVQLPISTECKNLDVIVNRSSIDISPSEVMGTSNVERFMKWAKENYDQVIFDCPPHGILGDAGVLAGQVCGVVLICRVNKSRRHAMRQAAQHFEDIGANLLGVVVNDVELNKDGYFGTYGYNQRYYQSKYKIDKDA